jgi:signal transduction histidine kinase
MDPQRTQQVLINLLSNATKFSPKNEWIILSAAVFRSDEPSKEVEIRFSVIDHGIGIEKEVQNSIFEQFYKSQNSRVRELNPYGNGIGLSISKEISKALKGDITVFSEVDKGACFDFYFPSILCDNIVAVKKEKKKAKAKVLAAEKLNASTSMTGLIEQ